MLVPNPHFLACTKSCSLHRTFVSKSIPCNIHTPCDTECILHYGCSMFGPRSTQYVVRYVCRPFREYLDSNWPGFFSYVHFCLWFERLHYSMFLMYFLVVFQVNNFWAQNNFSHVLGCKTPDYLIVTDRVPSYAARYDSTSARSHKWF